MKGCWHLFLRNRNNSQKWSEISVDCRWTMNWMGNENFVFNDTANNTKWFQNLYQGIFTSLPYAFGSIYSFPLIHLFWFQQNSLRLIEYFSTSIIIHAEKTKEITTVKEVWICELNYHKIWWTFVLIFSKNYEWFEKLYQTFERVFHLISKYLEVGLKKLGCASFFQPLLGVWISDETLFLVFDILLKNMCDRGLVRFRTSNRQQSPKLRINRWGMKSRLIGL